MKRAVLFFMFCICTSHAKLVINIDQGNFSQIPIALSDIKGESFYEDKIGTQIYEVINNDLLSCGLFKLLNKKSFLQRYDTLKQGVHFSEWRLIKADNLCVAKIKQISNDKIKIEFRLYDTVREIQLDGQSYTGNIDEWRRIAHKISDVIYKKLTGDEGYFDTKIVYVSRQQNGKKRTEKIAMMDQDGHNHTFLTDGKSLVLTPRFSPDMKYLTYLDYANHLPRVYLLDLITKAKYIVGNFTGMTFAPRFSPDSKKIIMSYAHEGNTSLFEMNLETRKIKRLTFSPVIDTSPCYSPDGKYIVFNSDRNGQPHLYVMSARGGSPKRISYGKGSYRTPVWSPRGDLIAFTKIYQGEFYIGVMNIDGSGERLITKGYLVEGPAWSSNGRIIMFTREEQKGVPQLHTIDLTGYHEKKLLTMNNAVQGFWSTPLQ